MQFCSTLYTGTLFTTNLAWRIPDRSPDIFVALKSYVPEEYQHPCYFKNPELLGSEQKSKFL